jgi:hypothetical protein
MEPWPTYLANLRRLPSVRKVKAHAGSHSDWDGILDIATDRAHASLPVEEKRGVLNVAMAERIVSLRHRSHDRWIVFAPYVTPHLAELLAREHVNFMDEAGNCHLELQPATFIHVAGRPRVRPASRTGLSTNGYRVLLALLVAPEVANATVRQLAAKAGVSKSTASEALLTLKEMGFLHATRAGKVLDRRHVLDRWVAGYADRLRPSLMLARYRPADKDLRTLEVKCEGALRRHGIRWAFSGGVAAERLTGHYRGPTTTIHVERSVPELSSELRLAPTADGSVTVLMSPAPVIFDHMPMPGTAPPALVYAELLAEGGERAREAAELIRTKFLASLS